MEKGEPIMIIPLLIASIAAAVAVFSHGYLGHLWFLTQLKRENFKATPTGDNDISYRVNFVSWHVVTSVFVASSIAFALLAFGVFNSTELARFISGMDLLFLFVGLYFFRDRLSALALPVPFVFATCMILGIAMPWVA
jgi:hypothetical protein